MICAEAEGSERCNGGAVLIARQRAASGVSVSDKVGAAYRGAAVELW